MIYEVLKRPPDEMSPEDVLPVKRHAVKSPADAQRLPSAPILESTNAHWSNVGV